MNQSAEVCNLLYRLAREQNGQNVDVDLNGVPILIIQCLEDADWVLRRNVANYDKNLDWLRQTLGPSRFSENGDAWKIRRELTQPHFNRFDRQRTVEIASRCACDAVRRFALESAEGVATLDDDIFREMTLSVLLESFFGIPLTESGIDTRNIARLMELGAAYSFVPLGKTHTLYQEELAQLPALRRKVLEDFRIFRSGTLPVTPLLADLLAADHDPASDIVLEQELLTLLAAGSEATAAAIGWACYLLAAYPDVQERLRQSVEGSWQSSLPDWGRLSALEDLSCFISETLRLYPTSPIASRVALGVDQIGQRDVVAGQRIMISWIGVQHDTRFHADPWLLHMGAADSRVGSKTAFSTGPRVCGGKQFALLELASVLGMFLKQARFELTSTAAPVFHWRSQMLRRGGQPIKITLINGRGE